MVVEQRKVSMVNSAGENVPFSFDDSNLPIIATRLIDPTSGNYAGINSDGQLHVVLEGKVIATNSSSEPLEAGETFTGVAFDTCPYSILIVSVFSDVVSATNGLNVQFSPDGINWDHHDYFTIPANAGKEFSFQTSCEFCRILYTNGSSAQGAFRLQLVAKKTYSKPSSHRISDSILGEDDAELMKSVLSGEDDSGVFRNVQVSNSSRLKVVSQPYGYAVSEDDIPNHSALLKFGTRTSIAANTPSVIWEGPTALYSYLTTAERLKIVSTDNTADVAGGTGARTLTLLGLDSNYDEISETVTMTGTTEVTTTASFIRVFRAYVATCGTGYTNAGTITIKNNASTITLATITAGDGQTLMTMWTVPSGKRLFLTVGTFSTDSNKGARVSLFIRRVPEAGLYYPWQIKYRAFTFSGNELFPFELPFPIPEKTDIEVRVNTPAAAGTTSAGSTFAGWYEPA